MKTVEEITITNEEDETIVPSTTATDENNLYLQLPPQMKQLYLQLPPQMKQLYLQLPPQMKQLYLQLPPQMKKLNN